jgi:hypothetical protein
LASFIVSSILSNVAPEIEAFMQFGETFPSLLQLKLCIREQIECVDAYELFTKQGNVLKSLFDNTNSSGVHISVEGCTKIRDEVNLYKIKT